MPELSLGTRTSNLKLMFNRFGAIGNLTPTNLGSYLILATATDRCKWSVGSSAVTTSRRFIKPRPGKCSSHTHSMLRWKHYTSHDHMMTSPRSSQMLFNDWSDDRA